MGITNFIFQIEEFNDKTNVFLDGSPVAMVT